MTWLWHLIYNNAPCFGAFVPNRVFHMKRLSDMKVHMLLDYIMLLLLQNIYQFIVHIMKGSCKGRVNQYKQLIKFLHCCYSSDQDQANK